MMKSDPQYRELDELVAALREQALDPHQRARLTDLLQRDPRCRRRFVDHHFLELELDETPAHVLDNPAPSGDVAPAARGTPQWLSPRARLFTTATLASAAAVTITLWQVHHGQPPSPASHSSDRPAHQAGAPPVDGTADAAPSHLAIIAQTIDATWGAGTTFPGPVKRGTPLAQGRLELDSGTVQLDFFSGASLVIDGRAAVEITGQNAARVFFGKVRAHVPPPARGFRLESHRFGIVDLGTEFAVEVTPDGGGEVHVIDGEIVLVPATGDSAPGEHLRTGEARSIGIDGGVTAVEPRPGDFASTETFRENLARRVRQWEQHLDTVRDDPATVALYDFTDDPWAQSLQNSAAAGTPASNASIVGGSWGEGRWEGKRAVRLDSPGSRIRTALEGELPDLTLAAWVKIERLGSKLISLISSEDRPDSNHLYWALQSMDMGASMVFADTGVQPGGGRQERRHYFCEPRVFWPAEENRWIHYAVVVDNSNRTVTHFRDGEVYTVLPLQGEPRPLQIGVADIGNWPFQAWAEGTEWEVRNLSGSIGEFLVSSRPYRPAEIAELHHVGRAP